MEGKYTLEEEMIILDPQQYIHLGNQLEQIFSNLDWLLPAPPQKTDAPQNTLKNISA